MITLSNFLLIYLAQLAIIGRVLLRTGLQPTVRLGWVMVIGLVPFLGLLLYALFGEVRLARTRVDRISAVREKLASGRLTTPETRAVVSAKATAAFATGEATSGFGPVTGNLARMLPEGDAQLDDLVAAIDAATDTVHICFYIWLNDAAGTGVAEAVIRASQRGVTVRVLVDDLGSRALIRSDLWQRMDAAGVRLNRALPLGNPFISLIFQRLDLRNHRKVVVIDNRITWCGSRNCADAAFAVKARFAPWVDVLLHFEGPIVRQMQAVFLQDWMLYADEDLAHLLEVAHPVRSDGFTAQVIATGPDQSRTSLSDTMCAMIYAAIDRITVTTPYFVPDQPTQAALCAAAIRGVSVTMILPERNDSRFVGAASESHYDELLAAGIRIMAFRPGLLHAKILTVDGHLALIGSTNMDRRSFNLNYENGILFDDVAMTAELDARQASYIDRAVEISAADVAQWSFGRRIRNNSLALAEPLL
jgi:cardiolipin synthase A/B